MPTGRRRELKALPAAADGEPPCAGNDSVAGNNGTSGGYLFFYIDGVPGRIRLHERCKGS